MRHGYLVALSRSYFNTGWEVSHFFRLLLKIKFAGIDVCIMCLSVRRRDCVNLCFTANNLQFSRRHSCFIHDLHNLCS